GHRLERRQDRPQVVRRVLAVDEQPVEPGSGADLRADRAAGRDPHAGDRRLAGQAPPASAPPGRSAEPACHRSEVTKVRVDDVAGSGEHRPGLCEPGGAGEFVRGGAIAPGGKLPLNTSGGQLSGFYLQGMTPLAEALIQLRGTGADRPHRRPRRSSRGPGPRQGGRMTPATPATRGDWLVAPELAPDPADPDLAPLYAGAARDALVMAFCAGCRLPLP